MPYERFQLGASRIGGVPDLPRGLEWPRWGAPKRNDKFGGPWHPSDATPLAFIAQINLEEVPRVDDLLPASGSLYFFYDRYCEPWGYDPADRGCCRVVYADCDPKSLIRSDPPPDADPDHMSEACLVEAWPELTLPDDLAELSYDSPAYDAYQEVREALTASGGLPHHHRLLGHPQLIQNPMELECQLASNGINCGSPKGYQSDEAKRLAPGAADWRLLLQIDTDEDGPGWMWGDVGRIYFWVKQQELAVQNFENVWLIFQCC